MTNDRFRKSLRLDFEGMDIKSKEELSNLMRQKNYHIKQYRGDELQLKPSKHQLDYAWTYLRKRFEIPITEFFVREKYGDRATDNIYIRGHLYKKGQFIPKRKS